MQITNDNEPLPRKEVVQNAYELVMDYLAEVYQGDTPYEVQCEIANKLRQVG